MHAVRREGFGAELSHINYSLFENEEFYIEPTDQRKELFYKFPKYSYQREARILLNGLKINNIDARYTLNIGLLANEDAILAAGIKMYFELTADIEEIESDEDVTFDEYELRVTTACGRKENTLYLKGFELIAFGRHLV